MNVNYPIAAYSRDLQGLYTQPTWYLEQLLLLNKHEYNALWNHTDGTHFITKLYQHILKGQINEPRRQAKTRCISSIDESTKVYKYKINRNYPLIPKPPRHKYKSTNSPPPKHDAMSVCELSSQIDNTTQCSSCYPCFDCTCSNHFHSISGYHK